MLHDYFFYIHVHVSIKCWVYRQSTETLVNVLIIDLHVHVHEFIAHIDREEGGEAVEVVGVLGHGQYLG